MGKSEWDYDCAVVGGGPGGLVAALYLKRFRRNIVLVNAGVSRASWIPKTRNLIGFKDGISGNSLLIRLNAQVANYKLEKINAYAQVHKHKSGFKVNVGKTQFLAKKVILATGIEDLQPNIENLEDLRRRGLLRYCPVCDAFEHCGKDLCVFIKDDFGIERALFLCHYTDSLTVVAPSDFKLSPQRERSLRGCGVKFICGDLVSVQRASLRRGIWINLKDKTAIFAHAAYVELGCTVRDEAFKSLRNLKRVKEGFLTVTSEQRLSVPGLFAVGDCVNLLGQLSVAAGQAAVAATTIHNDLIQEE